MASAEIVDKKRKREKDQEHILRLLSDMPLTDATAVVREVVLKFPGCCKSLYKCDECGLMVTFGKIHQEVHANERYKRDVCDNCCLWCSTCQIEFCGDGAYHHEECKTRAYLAHSEDEEEEEFGESEEESIEKAADTLDGKKDTPVITVPKA